MPLAPASTARARYNLACRPPYDWDHLERFFADHASPGVETVWPGCYARTFLVGETAGTLRVTFADDAVCVCIRSPDSGGCHEEILSRLRRMLDLDSDPVAIAVGLSRDPLTAGLVARRPGLRMPGAFDGFELAVRAILGQQVSVAAATRLAGRLVPAFGTLLTAAARDGEAGLTHLFPSPEQLAGAEVSRVLNMPRARGRAIQALAAATLATPDLFAPGGDLDDTVARLKALPGIGDWTAHYVAMRAMGQTDAFPSGDVGLMRALDTGAGRPDRVGLLDRATAWRPWRSYAAVHLWAEDAARRSA